MATYKHRLDDEHYEVFRDTAEIDMAELLQGYLEAHAEDPSVRIPTTRLASEALASRGIAPTGLRVDVVRDIGEDFGVPLDSQHRAYIEGNTWKVYGRDVQGEPLVDWDRRRRSR